jgi:hypothetical protein
MQRKQNANNRSTAHLPFAGSNSGNGFSSNADEIAVATKGLYRHINPMREIILNGLICI